jgi:hypothetical protein
VVPGRVRARDVGREALAIYRHRFRVVVAIGAILFAPLALVEAVAGVVIGDGLAASGGRRVAAVLVWLAVGLLMFGSALCTGFIDKLVGGEFGHEEVRFRDALRTVPYGRLIGVDVVQTLILGAATVVLILPGLIVFTLMSLAASLVLIEGRGVRSSLARSASLVARNIGTTLLVVTVPVVLEHQALHAVEAVLHLPLLALWVIHTAVAVMVLVPVVLAEITLAFTLTGHSLPARPGAARPVRSATA